MRNMHLLYTTERNKVKTLKQDTENLKQELKQKNEIIQKNYEEYNILKNGK